MIERFVNYLFERFERNEMIYPGPLQRYLVDTPLEVLSSYFVEDNYMHDSAKLDEWEQNPDPLVKVERHLYLTKLGQVETENYLLMCRTPSRKLSISKYVKEFARLPYERERKSKKILISNYEMAIKEQVEYAYFDGKDYLGLVPFSYKDDTMYDIHYAEDYEKYVVSHFPKVVIAQRYLDFLESTMERREGELVYDVDTYQMAHKSMSQRAEYTAVIDKYNDIIIPSDGLGVFSAMCILRGVKYQSWEPNIIGARAIKLNIITRADPIYEPKVYVFFYCVQYYALPFFPGHQFIIIDVPTIKKPGFSKSLHMAVSHKDMSIDYYFPPDPMSLQSCYCLDVVASQVTSVMKVAKRAALDAQFIVASSVSSIESSIQSGFYSKSYWKMVFDKMTKKDQVRHSSAEAIYARVREKTLLLFERSFPFRRNKKGKWKVENDVLRKEYGPGWYFQGNVMWYGSITDERNIRTDYTYESGYFVFKDSTKPQNIVTVHLYPPLDEIYMAESLKLFLVSTYKISGITYLTYVPECKILKKAILIDET